MPSRAVTLDAPGLARLDQALLGLLDPRELPPGDVYVDEEGTPVARVEGERVVAVRPRPWATPDDVRSAAPVVVPVVGQVPAEPLPRDAVLLLPAGGVRPDDARWVAWAEAWARAAATVVEIPLAPGEAADRRSDVAAHYSTGTVLDVETVTQPPGHGRVVFFTGLSGSGKSTLARGLVDRIARTHTVTLLDGDVVRTHLSKGLGFSREDRDTNIRRIGWVAAEVAKHGGVAVCAPIAPYDDTRRWVRAAVEAAAGPGAFALVWVATPLEVCESRDVKGLYAKARAGEVTGFTGVDDPYEEPADATVVVDTSVLSVDEALDRVEAALFPTG